MMGLIQVAHAYDVELYAEKRERAAKVRIGGNAASIGDKFVPNINMSKWDDEHFINLNFPIAITNQIETFDGEKVSISVGDYSFNYFPLNTDDLEFEIVFDKKPPIMSFSLDILNSENLDYFYQPALTQTEIDDGHIRQDNVVGSYAVYCKKKDNKYCTGKFCHIYYPYLKDSNGIMVRVDGFNISNGHMTIILPSAWMSSARYPVTLDPTLGYTTAGASSWANIAGKEGHGLSDASGGVVNKYHIAISAIGAPANVKMGIYYEENTNDTIENGGLGAALSEQSGAFVVAVNDDNQCVSAGFSLAASSRYGIVSFPESGTTAVKLDSGSAGTSWYLGGPTYAAQCANPATSGWTSGSDLYSQWIDYAAAGATLEQEGFRFRKDDGDETTATWDAAQDANIQAPAGTTKRLRFIVNATGDPDATQYQLEGKLSTDSAWTKIT